MTVKEQTKLMETDRILLLEHRDKMLDELDGLDPAVLRELMKAQIRMEHWRDSLDLWASAGALVYIATLVGFRHLPVQVSVLLILAGVAMVGVAHIRKHRQVVEMDYRRVWYCCYRLGTLEEADGWHTENRE